MESQRIVSEDTRLCLKDEYQSAYSNRQDPNHGTAVVIFDLLKALEWAENELALRM